MQRHSLNCTRDEDICPLCASAAQLLEICDEMLQCVCDYNEGKDWEVNEWIKNWDNIISKAKREE